MGNDTVHQVYHILLSFSKIDKTKEIKKITTFNVVKGKYSRRKVYHFTYQIGLDRSVAVLAS